MSAKKKIAYEPSQKDDGTRWIVVDTEGKPVYLGSQGVTKYEAIRLATGLINPSGIKQVS